MTDFDFQIDSFMFYCTSKNLSSKTMKSFEQTISYIINKHLYSIESIAWNVNEIERWSLF